MRRIQGVHNTLLIRFVDFNLRREGSPGVETPYSVATQSNELGIQGVKYNLKRFFELQQGLVDREGRDTILSAVNNLSSTDEL